MSATKPAFGNSATGGTTIKIESYFYDQDDIGLNYCEITAKK